MTIKELSEKKFNLEMHHLRGIAILFICFLHLYAPLYLSKTTSWSWWIWRDSFFHNSTGIFVFISGFLTYTIEYKRFVNASFSNWYKQYVLKKIKNILIPMILLSLLVYFLYLVFSVGFLSYGGPREGIVNHIWYFIMGGAQPQFWYIPFAMFIFLTLVPLLFKMKKEWVARIAAVLLLLPFLVVRGSADFSNSSDGFINFFQVLCYFSPYFVIGFVYAQNEEVIFSWLKANIISITVLMIVTTAFLVYQASFPMPTFREHFRYMLSHIHKLSMIGVLIYILSFIKTKVWILDVLAKFSFCLYFLHMYIGNAFIFPSMYKIFRNFECFQSVAGSFFIAFFAFVITMVLCVYMGKICRKIFGKYSRSICGY